MISEGILGNFHCKVQYFVFNLTFHVWHATMRFEFLRNLWNIALTEFELPVGVNALHPTDKEEYTRHAPSFDNICPFIYIS